VKAALAGSGQAYEAEPVAPDFEDVFLVRTHPSNEAPEGEAPQ